MFSTFIVDCTVIKPSGRLIRRNDVEKNKIKFIQYFKIEKSQHYNKTMMTTRVDTSYIRVFIIIEKHSFYNQLSDTVESRSQCGDRSYITLHDIFFLF